MALRCQRPFLVQAVHYCETTQAANGLSTKAFHGARGNSVQNFRGLVDIFLRHVQEEPGKALDADYSFHSWCFQAVKNEPQLIAYVDGSSHGNPGPSGIGVIVEDPDGNRVRIAKWIGWQDNNVAEYIALLEALHCALERKASSLCVFSDSDVVVRQMSGEYACRSPRLYSLNWICRKLARTIGFAIWRIPREHNIEANSLANSAARRFLGAETP